MSFCSFADGAAMFDATPIENLFLTEYMYDAPEQALKVYLYARMLALHPELGGGTADMAVALRMTEDEVISAFGYWERRALVRGVSANPPAWQFLPVRAQEAGAGSALDQEIYANRDFNNSMQKLFGNNLIGQHELSKASDWVNILRFDKDAVVRLLEYGIQTSRVRNPKPSSVFKRMDALAEEWSKRGIHTLEQVERAAVAEKWLGIARDVLKKLGMKREPSDPELEMARRWVDEWGFDKKQILDACEVTTNARNPSFNYLDSILASRRGGDPGEYRDLVAVLKELNPKSAQPTPDQEERYHALRQQGIDPELIRLAAIQCHQANKYRFDDLEWRLKVWQDDGVTTPGEAEAFMKRMGALKKQLREVLQAAGSERSPSYDDIKAYERWKDAWPDDLIAFAAECSRGAGGSMAYMDKLLTRWGEAGITTVEAARAQHAAWKAAQGKEAPANPALNYEQREYRDEDFGDDFYFDYEKFYGDGGDGK